MVDYEILFTQNRIHNRWHRLYNRIDQVTFYHRDPSCIRCHPPLPNTLQFDHFWNWYSVENPAIEYTRNTQQALINLDASLTVVETWEAIYSIVFSIRYSIEPRPYTQLRQELYNAYILTDTFRKDPFEELYQISEANASTDSDSSTGSFDIPNNFHPLLHGLLNQGPATPGLLFTDEYLHIESLFREEPVGLLFLDKDLNLNRLFPEPEPVGLLFADEDLHLNQLFEEPEVPGMAALGGGFNPNILLNALNNLTNALGAGGNNWANVNNAVNALNATLTANNNAMHNRGTQAAQVPTFYGGNQDPIAWLNEFNLAYAANGWNNTLQAAIDRARACELTLREGKKKPSNYATTVQSETTELAKIVSTLVTQVGELTRKVETQPNRYRPPRNDDPNPRDNVNNRNVTPGNPSVTCYACGQPGHISRRCPNRGTNTINDKAAIDPNTLQTLIQQLAAQNQLGATKEKEDPPITTDVAVEPTVRMEEIRPTGSTESVQGNVQRIVQPTISTVQPTPIRPKKKMVARKRPLQKPQPSIAAHIQPYNIVADLQQQRANISFGQLFQISPKLRSDVGKSIRKPEIPMERRRKQEETNRKGEEEEEDMSEEEEETEEEYEEEDLDEKVFCHFKVKQRPSPRIEQNFSLQLTCRFQEVVIDGIYPKENFVLTKGGVYLDKSFYLWTYFARLNEQFQRKPPKRATWTYDWKGPTARCWCGDRLVSPSDSCSRCYEELTNYITVQRLSPRIVAEISSDFENRNLDPDNLVQDAMPSEVQLEEVVDVANEHDRQLCFYCKKKDPDEWKRQNEVPLHFGHAELTQEWDAKLFELPMGDLTKEQKTNLVDLLQQYRHLFAWDATQLGRTDLVQHTIDVGNATPIKKRWYRTSRMERDFIAGEIDRMLQQNLIEKSRGPWAFP
ncbi:unnamed protein product [Rhizophagus irregularis]|nr:unnamed protein product [Rhizophagus irregularis]